MHFLVYMPDDKLHKLHWLNPQEFGPYDHKWKEAAKKGADILCTNNKGGDLENDCASDDDGVGITHYRVRVLDEDGNTEYVQTKSVQDMDGYTANFNLNDGTYTFQIDAGYKKKGTNSFYVLSDTAQVQFSIPGDFRRWNQSPEEFSGLVEDVNGKVAGEKDDSDAFYGSVWNLDGLKDDGSGVMKSGPAVFRTEGDDTFSYTSADGEPTTYAASDGTATPCTDVTDPAVPAEGEACHTTYDTFVKEATAAISVYLNNLYN